LNIIINFIEKKKTGKVGIPPTPKGDGLPALFPVYGPFAWEHNRWKNLSKERE
jgi:hypothetical protein